MDLVSGHSPNVYIIMAIYSNVYLLLLDEMSSLLCIVKRSKSVDTTAEGANYNIWPHG